MQNISFILQYILIKVNSCLHQNNKNENVIDHEINLKVLSLFVPNIPYAYHLKTSENETYEKGKLTRNELNMFNCIFLGYI